VEYIEKNYRGLSLIVTLNWDRVLVIGMILAAFYGGAYLAGH
jgi:hypothetical protein